MIDINIFEEILVVVINIIGVWLAFWVYFANRKEKLNQWFAVMTFFMILWVDFSFLGYSAGNSSFALLFYQLNWASVALFSITFFYFYIIYFLKQVGKYKILGSAIAILGIFFVALSLFTDLIIKGVVTKDWGFEIIFGAGNDFFNLYTFVVALVVIILLIKKYFSFDKKKKEQIKYFLVGTFLFVLFNIIFNIITPIFTNTVVYQHFGDYSAIFLLVLTAYAIVKHELMGIKTLLTQVLVVVISIILLVDVFFLSDNPTMQLLKLGILLAFLYFSREMVKSAKKEKESREELEKINKHLKEKTQDLESLLSLNEMVSVSVEIEKSVQNIMDAVPSKLGHLGIMGTILIRYSEKHKKACAYIITESDEMRQARKYLTKPELSDYCLNINNEDLENRNLIIKSIINNKIEKGSNFADFVSPSMDRYAALKIQKSLNGKAFVSIPMTIRGKKKGALVFIFTKEVAEVSLRDLDLIKAFTQHVTVVLDNLQFYHNLNRNIEELTRAKDKLKEMLVMKNDFLHIVSHQLRTPLTAMRGFISMWSDGDFDNLPAAKMAEVKKRIVNNVERLNNMVNDMVLAMESEGEFKICLQPVDIRKIIQSNIEMMKPGFESKKLYLKYSETAKNIPQIEADEKLLLNVFMNLIDNAEKYTDKGGLTIKADRDGDDKIKISFIDTGIGLSKDDKKILFKKFSRGKKSNYINPNGSGLGLFIIKQIIRKHRGEIKATSKGEGKGTAFTITLPARQGR